MKRALRALRAALFSPRSYAALAAPAVILASLHVTVRPGDTLTRIAKAHCGTASDWTGIYAASHLHGSPDMIYVGQRLTLSCTHARLHVQLQAPVHVTTAIAHGTTSRQQCIIARESGGNPGIWNPTGHWGLYQFSYGTWVAHGGPPALFGKASAAEQTVVFWKTVAQDGYSDWAPYDGC